MIALNTLRCAIYTRKSTELGLQQEFSSIDAQREAGEAYIENRQEDGWRTLSGRYDDGGFSGGSLERPALQRLLTDIKQNGVDCVVVYKVDRLSRSLLDFARLMQVFQEHDVTFVAVSQDFNTATPMGRLMLHVLLSFAQFEREIIAERTRDKLGAARRKGKWLGSRPVLGYDADWEQARLVPNQQEAARVRAIFALYEETGSLSATVRELRRRDWHNKRSQTRDGNWRGGSPFTKGSLHGLLTNVTYLGQVKYKGEVFAGEHAPIVAPEVFERVRDRLARNRRRPTNGRKTRLRSPLKGKLHCGTCGAPMTHSVTAKGTRRYRYYLCPSEHEFSTSIPAGALEAFVLRELRSELLGSGRKTADLYDQVARIDHDVQLGDLRIGLALTHGAKQPHTIHKKAWFRSDKSQALEHGTSRHKDPARAPRVARLMALAIHFDQLLQAGNVRDYQELSNLAGASRSRISQIMKLCLLAPDIQEAILFLPSSIAKRDAVSERDLRPIVAEARWPKQRALWSELARTRRLT